MHYSAWFPIAFLFLALAVSLIVLTRRGLRTWRSLRAFTASAEQALDAVNASAAKAETHAATFTAATERLERAQARLSASLAELAVLRAAADEVRASVSRVRGLVPRKGRA
jgi:cytochrome c biogenesis protein ResB